MWVCASVGDQLLKIVFIYGVGVIARRADVDAEECGSVAQGWNKIDRAMSVFPIPAFGTRSQYRIARRCARFNSCDRACSGA
jgi:hypothetical protein